MKYISVFVPVYNGEKYLSELIEAVLSQVMPRGYKLEFLMTDSGSTDRSVEIIKHYGSKIHLNEIPNSEYGHGKTRQKAAEKSKGEFILYLSQDATPTSTRWIIDMIEPFFISDKVGAVFGRQIPRPTSVPTIKREVSSVFDALGVLDSLVLHRERSLVDDAPVNQLNTFFSDVNSAVRKDLIAKIPFQDLKYAEDQALAKDIQSNGYLKAYSARGAVWHSNEYNISEFRKRKYDEYVGLINSVGYNITHPLRTALLGWIKPTLKDMLFTLRDPEYSNKRKLYYLVIAIGYNLSVVWGRYDASKYSVADHAKKSLEESRKS